MTLAGWVMILFWLGFLMYGIVMWGLNKTFEQLNDIENIELDELDRDNINQDDFVGKLLNDNATLYLIVLKDIMDRILSGDKLIEYRDVGKYWDKRIKGRDYSLIRITNGYGNETRPYILLKYKGYEVVEYQGKPHYSIPINRELWIEHREEVGGKIKK